MLTPREKSPLPENFPPRRIKPVTLWTASPNTTNELFRRPSDRTESIAWCLRNVGFYFQNREACVLLFKNRQFVCQLVVVNVPLVMNDSVLNTRAYAVYTVSSCGNVSDRLAHQNETLRVKRPSLSSVLKTGVVTLLCRHNFPLSLHAGMYVSNWSTRRPGQHERTIHVQTVQKHVC